MAYMASLVYKDKGTEHLNVVVKDTNLGFHGIIPYRGTVSDRIGTTIAVYCGERDLRKSGEKLPAPLDMYNDCPYMHYGALLNCLAYMSPESPQEMIVVLNETNELFRIQYKPFIAEQFLNALSPIKKEEVIRKRKGKMARIDPNQKALF